MIAWYWLLAAAFGGFCGGWFVAALCYISSGDFSPMQIDDDTYVE